MQNYPLFSVLIANYNNGKYLQEAIDSVFAQTYTNWEIIIVDDASTDNSQEIYRQYSDDDRIHVFFNDENKGCGYTKHQCVIKSTGKYCGFLDADDILLENALDVSVKKLESDDHLSLCFSRYYFCNEKLEITDELRKLELPPNRSYLENQDFSPEHFASFPKEAYLKTEGINPIFMAGVDQDLYFHLEEVGEIAILDCFTYKYRLHGNSVSMGLNSDKAAFWNTIARHEACVRRGISSEKYAMNAFCVLRNRINDCMKEINKARSSYSYRLGKAILKPVSWIRPSKD